MSGLQSTPALLALRTQLFKIYMDTTAKPGFAKTHGFFTEMPSSHEFNTYGWMAQLSGMREWVGHRVVDGLKERSYVIYNRDYEKTIGIARNAIADGNVVDAMMAVQALADTVQRLPDDLLLALLEGGQAAAVGGLAYDGQFFYDTDHPISIDDVSGTQRNYYASGLALDATNLKAAIAAMQSFRGENNMPRGIGDDGLMLLTGPGLWGQALDVTEAKTLSAGGENVIATKFGVKPVKWARLSSSTRWFLFDLYSPGPKPFILQTRQASNLVAKTSPENDNVFFDKQLIWGADTRMGAGYAQWAKAFSAAA